MHADMDKMCLLSYCLDLHVLVINVKFSTKKKTINTGNYCVPIKKLKYEAMCYEVMIYSSNSMHCEISSTDKDNNKTCADPAEIIFDTKLLVLKHEGKHFNH